MEFTTSSDRAPPPTVKPVERKGVRYTQASDGRDLGADRADGVLVATDKATGRQLWVLSVYRTPRQEGLEEDAQWRFFTKMTWDPDGRLRIANEAGQSFLVDVDTQRVTALP